MPINSLEDIRPSEPEVISNLNLSNQGSDTGNSVPKQQPPLTESEITQGYSGPCDAFSSYFFSMLTTAISMLQRILALLDSAKNDIDSAYLGSPPFPDLPELPKFPSLEFPGDISWLSCPLAQCMGFPKLPKFDFSGGLPDLGGASEELIADVNEYVDAFDGMGSAYALTMGNVIKIQAQNALTILRNAPQSALNGIIDTATFAISEIADGLFFDRMDKIVECVLQADKSYASNEKVKQYLRLREQYSESNGGAQNLDKMGLNDGALGEIKEYQRHQTVITDNLNGATEMIDASSEYDIDDSIGLF